ncbi:CDP-glycerol glycerophosphotransferase family protein [Terribacillus halophilus]|uniref:CDP-glycerol glycerophosphotransferase family protein n=1 Tax=Terribacillus halophilus TaxID=361279 RepID=UPI00117DEB60|nr:CDP-glycerol glycerophosphotransferase family protein [Terribacillus halophilus]
MFISSIDNKNIPVDRNAIVESDITDLSINGPYLEIEGYASVKDIKTYAEDRTRKSLLLVPNLDIEKLQKDNENLQDTDPMEILEMHTITIALDNCKYGELKNVDPFITEDMDLLDGFKGVINLSAMHNGKPLQAGEYDCFIKLEQMAAEEDTTKYEKIIPLSNVKTFFKSDLLTTKLEYFSAKKVQKYNLLISFNTYTKTLNLKNSLLQSYDPRNMPDNEETKEHRLVKAFKRRFFRLFYMLFCLFPIKSKKVVFASDSRSELDGNFYFVYEELHRRNMDLDILFLFNERINNKKTITDLLKMAYHFATSKIILLDDFYPLIYPLKIRPNAELIQIWHAAGAFKTFGYSRIGRPGGPSPHSKNHRNYTKAVVSSEGVRKNYSEGFGISLDKVVPTGVPRADIFSDEEYKAYVRNRLFDKYPHLKEKKVILFAPTFRGNGQASAHYPFETLNLKQLYEQLHEEYVFLFKIHPFVKNNLTIPYEYADFFYDFSEYREINDLLLVTDILITDYSSVCFEFALLNRPMLFFGFDVEKYIQDRDFYYNFFEFIPGPLLKTTDEMIYAIKNEEFEMHKIKPFVDYFFDDTLGKASRNVVDQLILPGLENKPEVIDKEKVILPPPVSRIELFERSMQKNEEEEE